jgi:hypothetical protein
MRQAAPLLSPDGIMAGDDYSDAGSWGVCRAVSEAAPGHKVFSGWIWIATREELAAGFAAVAA